MTPDVGFVIGIVLGFVFALALVAIAQGPDDESE